MLYFFLELMLCSLWPVKSSIVNDFGSWFCWHEVQYINGKLYQMLDVFDGGRVLWVLVRGLSSVYC